MVFSLLCPALRVYITFNRPSVLHVGYIFQTNFPTPPVFVLLLRHLSFQVSLCSLHIHTALEIALKYPSFKLWNTWKMHRYHRDQV